MMDMKSIMIEFQLLITNPSLQAILTDQSIKKDWNVVAYTIGGQQGVNNMQQNLM